MPIGIVTDEEFATELSKTTRGRKEVSVSKGRARGDTNVPESLRKIIGETAVIDGREAALELANDLGVSSSSVSAYANGSTSTSSYNSPNKELIKHINRSRERATKRASSVLTRALGAITQDKLDYSDAKDLSSIAKDMSVIIKNMEPQAEPSGEGGVKQQQFVIFAPIFRKEESFDAITVNE